VCRHRQRDTRPARCCAPIWRPRPAIRTAPGTARSVVASNGSSWSPRRPTTAVPTSPTRRSPASHPTCSTTKALPLHDLWRIPAPPVMIRSVRHVPLARPGRCDGSHGIGFGNRAVYTPYTIHQFNMCNCTLGPTPPEAPLPAPARAPVRAPATPRHTPAQHPHRTRTRPGPGAQKRSRWTRRSPARSTTYP